MLTDKHEPIADCDCQACAVVERDKLRAEVADALRDKLAGILSRTAVALRGPEPPLTSWSWHDLPERAEAAIAAIALVQAAERQRAADIVRNAASAHGLCCADCVALADLIDGPGA